MKAINWNADKNHLLMTERNLSFEDVLFSMRQGLILDDLIHPNIAKYPNQRIMVVQIGHQACLVPYVETEHELFLKTIIASRKATKQYLR